MAKIVLGLLLAATAAHAQAVNPTTLPDATLNVPYSQAFTVPGFTGLTWSLTPLAPATTAPPALSIGSSSGVLSGTPTRGGSFPFRITASGSGLPTAVSRDYTLVVATPAFAINSVGNQAVQAGSAYSLQLTASGGTPNYAWSLQSGALPGGITLSSTGLLSGTPTGSGTFNFTVQATDSSFNPAQTATLPIVVVVDPPMTITPSTLPNAASGVAYSTALAVSGGTSPFTWTLTGGALPSGFTLSSGGVISGTTAATGNFPITVTVADPYFSTSSSLRLTVFPRLLFTTTSPLAGGEVGIAYTQTFGATGGTPPYTFSLPTGEVLPPGLTLASGGGLTGTPTAAGTFTFRVQVNDSSTAFPQTAISSFSLTIQPALSITTATPLPAGATGVAYSLTFSASGGTGSNTWTLAGGSLPGGMTLTAGGLLSGSPAVTGTFTFTIGVTDGVGLASGRFSLTVAAPLSITTASPLPNGEAGVAYNLTLAAADGTSPYSWSIATGTLPTGILLSTGGVLSGTTSQSGTFVFTARVADSNTASPQAATKTFSLPILPALGITTASPLPGGSPGTAYSQTLSATGGTSTYTWSVTAGALPSGLSLSAAGALSGTPTASGTFNFTATVADGIGSLGKAFTLLVGAPLSITTKSPLAVGEVGIAYSVTLVGTGGVTPYTWTTASGALPAGLTLSSAGVLSGTPTAAGTASFSVRVADTGPPVQVANSTYSLTIYPALSITTLSPLTRGVVGVAYSQSLGAAGGSGTYTWSVTAGTLPTGITLSAAGVVSGTPTEVAASIFTVTVSDGVTSVSKGFGILVLAELAVTTASPLPVGVIGTAYSQTLGAAGGSTPYDWSLSSGSLPAGLTLTAAGVISGTPTAAGSSSFTVQVVENGGQGPQFTSASFRLTVGSPVSITTTAVGPGAVGQSFSNTLAASGGTTPYTWSATGLPSWMGLTAAGVLTGTPPAAGSTTITVQVKDSLGLTASKSFTLNVASSALTILNTSPLPDGVVALGYTQFLDASGGTGTYTWTLSGSLPPGLTFSSAGVITGIPTVAGSYSFALRVQDSAQQSATATFTVRIASLLITTRFLGNGQVGVPYEETLRTFGAKGAVTWKLTSGGIPGVILTSGGVLQGKPTTYGTYTFSVSAVDASGASATQSYEVFIYPTDVTFTTASPLHDATVGRFYDGFFTATGGYGNYSYAVPQDGSFPPGLIVSAGGNIGGIPTDSGLFTFLATVTSTSPDGFVSLIGLRFYTMLVQADVSILTGLTPGVVGTSYSAQLTASGGTPPYSWSITSGTIPPGMQMLAGTVSGTPTVPGNYPLTITVSDAKGLSVSRDFTLVITTVVRPPSLTTNATLPPGKVGVLYTLVLTAGGGTAPYSFTLTGGQLPLGINLLPGGIISGVPLEPGDFSFNVTVTDNVLANSRQTLKLTVQPGSLAITTTSVANGVVGEQYAQGFGASGGVVPYTWTVSGNLPPGTSALQNSLFGTPTVAGKYDITVSVQDSAGVSVTRNFTVLIAPAGLVIATGDPLPDGVMNRPYTMSAAASSGVPPYAWSADALPAGLAMASSGTLSGTPTVDGRVTVELRVTDSAGTIATRMFSLTINPQALSITTLPDLGSIPLNELYTRRLAASGGVPPYTWSLANGVYGGLQMAGDGTLSGRPQELGTFRFTVLVADARDGRATREFNISVVAPPILLSGPTQTTGVVGIPLSTQINVTGGVKPLTWSAQGLPGGTAIDPASGAIGGAPSGAGAFPVIVTVTDALQRTASQAFTITITVAQLPPVTITGLPATAPAGGQNGLGLTLGSTYPVPITGQLRLTFTPDGGGASDPSVQFATGGTSANFTIPAGSVTAQFSIPVMAIQTGSVAGVITITATFSALGTDITPSPPPTATIRVPAAAPSIRSVTAVRTSGVITVTVQGLVTTREMTQAAFRFNPTPGSNLQTTDLTVPVQSVFAAWYRAAAAAPFGGQFSYVQSFNVQGDTASVASVTVTLVNSIGSSQPVTATVP